MVEEHKRQKHVAAFIYECKVQCRISDKILVKCAALTLTSIAIFPKHAKQSVAVPLACS